MMLFTARLFEMLFLPAANEGPPKSRIVGRTLNRRDLALMSILFVVFLVIDLTVATSFFQTGIEKIDDAMFQSDVRRFVNYLTKPNITDPRSANHPLFVLFFNKIGTSLMSLAPATEKSRLFFSVSFCVVFGCLGIVLFYAILRAHRLDALTSFLWSLIFGLSTSHLTFSCIPETWIVSEFSLLALLATAFTISEHRFPLLFFAALIFSFGICISNIVFGRHAAVSGN